MKQEIRFCTAGDGVRIAYALAGSGTPLVKTANWLNHLEFDWESPIWRPFLEPLARRHLLVRYDARGNGLSDWDVPEISLDAFVRDLETVVDDAGLERFSLFGISQGCAVSVAYAVRHQERVEKLVLFGGYAQGWRARGEREEIERREAMGRLIETGWGQDNPAFRQVFTSLFVPGGTQEQMRWFNDLQRISTSPANALRIANVVSELDVLDLLPLVKTPTLVLHSRGDANIPFRAGRVFATRIRGTRFVPLESENHLLLQQEPAHQRALEEILTFLGSPDPTLSWEKGALQARGSDHASSRVRPRQWTEVNRLFDLALDVHPPDREAWLNQACGGDQDLRARVARLLAAAELDDDFMTGGAMRGALGDMVQDSLEGVVLAEGQRLGLYTVGAPLGRGGMGTVYRARHEALARDVAIKALAGAWPADAASFRRFAQEARLLARLNHPNIATVHDLLDVDGRQYLVMELVEGPTLAELLERGALPWREAANIAAQLSDALAEAHAHGIVHRDLKPSNVKLTPQGRVKVLDFGIAKSITPADYRSPGLTTATGVLLGTPCYMSPEQARAELVDARADIWALGCIVYEMLTGRRAFSGTGPSDVLAAVLRDEVDITRVPDDVPPHLVEILTRCLDKDPAARFQDIREVQALLVPPGARRSSGESGGTLPHVGS
jgi:pimeloyl-ACP methyl ester carboxylesterase